MKCTINTVWDIFSSDFKVLRIFFVNFDFVKKTKHALGTVGLLKLVI